MDFYLLMHTASDRRWTRPSSWVPWTQLPQDTTAEVLYVRKCVYYARKPDKKYTKNKPTWFAQTICGYITPAQKIQISHHAYWNSCFPPNCRWWRWCDDRGTDVPLWDATVPPSVDMRASSEQSSTKRQRKSKSPTPAGWKEPASRGSRLRWKPI